MGAAELLHQVGEVGRAHLDVLLRRRQHTERELRQLEPAGVLAAGGRQQLHQAVGVRRRLDVGGEGRLLRDQRGDEVGIELVLVGVVLDQRPVVDREQHPQQLRGQRLPARRQVLRIGPLHDVDAGAQLAALVEDPADGRLNRRRVAPHLLRVVELVERLIVEREAQKGPHHGLVGRQRRR